MLWFHKTWLSFFFSSQNGRRQLVGSGKATVLVPSETHERHDSPENGGHSEYIIIKIIMMTCSELKISSFSTLYVPLTKTKTRYCFFAFLKQLSRRHRRSYCCGTFISYTFIYTWWYIIIRAGRTVITPKNILVLAFFICD